MIQNFAICTKFTISGVVGFGLTGLVVVLIVLPVAVVVVGSVVLTSRAIVAPVGTGLKCSILWPLLLSESRDVLLVVLRAVGFFVDGVNGVGLFVHLHSVIGEVNFVCVFYRQSGLILVGKESTDVFWSSRFEHLGEHEIGEIVDVVIDGLSE